MKTVVITGANGLLGQKLVPLFFSSEYKLIATGTGECRFDIGDATYIKLDITDKEELGVFFSTHQPDILINTAAMTNVDACEDSREACWEVNVTAVESLAKCCTQYNTHLIHLSTDFVFDGENGPYSEEDTPNALSYYGKSKQASEEVLAKSAGLSWAIARTIIIYGIAEKMSRTNIVLWAKGALEKGDPINVVDDQFRSPTLAEDLAQGCFLIAEKGAEGIFHISGGETMSIIDLVYRVADYYKLDKNCITTISSASLNQAAKRPPRTGFDISKAKNELGYTPHSFEEGLKVLTRQLAE